MTEKEPFFSIILPFYNREKSLEACLESLVGQSFKDIEIIAVNDGSIDGSAEIVKSISRNSTIPITLINKINGGVSSARNIGIGQAKGQYVLFVDSDDSVSDEYCKRIFAELNHYNLPDIMLFGLTKVYVDRENEVSRSRICRLCFFQCGGNCREIVVPTSQ